MRWWAAFALSLCSAFAQAEPWVSDQGTQIEWVSESETLRPGQTHWIGLSITPPEGWHTYWRNPGASGSPATLSVEPNSAVVLGGFRWPAPERKQFSGLNVYGYESSVLLAMPAVLTRGQPQTLTAQANWLICKDLCIPESATVKITLTPGEGQPSQWSDRFGQARAAWPAQDPMMGKWDVAGRAGFELPVGMDTGRWAFFPYDNKIWGAEFYQEVRPFDGRLVFDAPQNEQWPAGELVNLDARQSWRVEFERAPVASSYPLLWMLLGAAAGGIILNLMPCVFPVLSIKAMGVLHLSGAQRRERRMRGHVFALGVLASFALIGAVLLGLQGAGAAIGWGFQLQSPAFVLFMAALMVALGASMLGVFKLGGALMGLGQGLTERGGYQGEFFAGVLAVLVASPCTAPFMGPALGFALASPGWVLFLILAALGVGFAAPMWLVHQSDRLAGWLPSPGVWMQRLQQGLAFPMFATGAWLAWVGGRQLGIDVPFWVFLTPVLLAAVVWLFRSFGRVWSSGLSGLLLLSVLAWNWPSARAGVSWQSFNQDALAQAQQSGATVLVNVTADWCISCLSNERLVFQSGEFDQADVVWLKADWTDYDPVITSYLDSFGRAGVPLYVLYKNGQTRVLPQILTVAMVSEALATN